VKLSDITEKLFKRSQQDDNDPNAELPPIQQASDQSLEELQLVEHVKKKIDMVRQTNSRIAIEGIYLTNVAYLMGFDGVYYDSTYRMFKNMDPKRKVTRSRFKVNKILATVQNRLARLTQSAPMYDVRPESNSQDDKDAAKLGVQIIEDVFDKQKFTEIRQNLIMSTMQGGHAYLQVTWDPTLGKPMVDPETGEPAGYEGDIRIEVLNCLNVYPDPLAKNIEEAQYVIKAKTRKLEYFRNHYERGNAVKEEQTWLISNLYDMKTNALTAVGITGAQTQDQARDSAIEIVYYEKRSEKHPRGRMCVIASGILLENKELPIGQFDIIKFDDIIIGDRYSSEAVITHLRPLQDQYNITRTKVADWIRKTLGGKYLMARGSELIEEALNNDSGEILEYTPVPNAPPPTALAVPQVPPYVYKDLDTQNSEFDFISGINQVSRGVLPSASIPAAGIQMLQEQDQTRMGVQTSRNEIGFAKVGQCILKYAHKNYVMPRMLKIAGEGLEYTVKEFVGEDIGENFDVIVVPGSTAPSSKVLRNQDIMQAWQSGLLGNPADDKVRMKVLKMMEYGDREEMWKDQALDQAQVKKAIAAIEQGDMPQLNQFDNHVVHLQEMNQYRKQDKFNLMTPESQKIFMYVMEWHLNALADLANPALAQQKMQAENALKMAPLAMQKTQQTIDQMHPGSPQNAGQPPQQPPQLDSQGAPVMQQPA
jgi:hypothetical protein